MLHDCGPVRMQLVRFVMHVLYLRGRILYYELRLPHCTRVRRHLPNGMFLPVLLVGLLFFEHQLRLFHLSLARRISV